MEMLTKSFRNENTITEMNILQQISNRVGEAEDQISNWKIHKQQTPNENSKKKKE